MALDWVAMALPAGTLSNRDARRRLVLLVLALSALSTAVRLDAQFRQRGPGRGFFNARRATADDFDGSFNFCRVAFASDFRGDGANWSVDYPRADINLSIRRRS